MSIFKRSVVSQIEITESNTVQVRFGKQVVDGSEVVSNTWHRTIFEPNSNIDDIMVAVNVDLEYQGYPAVSVEEIDRIKSFASIAWES